MRLRFLPLALALFAACGGGDDDMGRFFSNSRNLYGLQGDVGAGGHLGCVNVQNTPTDEVEPFVITLIPPTTVTAAPGNSGFQQQALANVYAEVQFGFGASSRPTAQVDVAQGISFPGRGGAVSVTIRNDNTPTSGPGVVPATPIAKGVGAFIAPGNFATGTPRRTILPTIGGKAISSTNPIASPGGSDIMQIPAYAQSVSVLVLPGAGPTLQWEIAFVDVNNTVIAAVLTTSTSQLSLTAEVPSDAVKFLISNFAGQAPLNSVRAIFDLGL